MKNDNIEIISKRRILFVIVITLILFSIIIYSISKMQLFNLKASLSELEKLSTKKIYVDSKPRGKIYDCNYNVIVDNIGTNKIAYNKDYHIKQKDEIALAHLLAENIDVNYDKLTLKMIKEYWIINNINLANNKITKEEYDLYNKRKLKASDLEKLKIDRITDDEISVYNDIDKEAIYIYYLMNKGYYYDEKTIKDEASDNEIAFVAQNKNNLSGISIVTSWKRIYPYGDTLRQILGNVSSNSQGIPEDLKDKYNTKNYSLNDRVGISYLELEYDKYLKATKDEYVIKNGKKKLVKEGVQGNDIVLSIDINLQRELENIITEEMIKAKSEANSNYYNHTSVVITNPKTGNILALASKQINKTGDEYKVSDYSSNLLTGSDTPGSIVKGASMLVGYKTGKLNIGDAFYDKCIKFKNTPQKCSWSKSLGTLNDITALKMSSNSYQFQLALKVANVDYYYNMPIKIDNTAIDTYRGIFNSLGLGVKSGIDLPNETEGYKGKSSNVGLLLNYAIGQYDTYSVLQLSSYINTIANEGERLKLSMIKEIKNSSNNEIIYKYEKNVLNTIDIENKYFKRVKEGFKSVLDGPLGRGYMGKSPNPAGKTGTSESFYDSDLDGKVDKETYTKSFIGYAPYDDPVMSIVSISPHISYKNDHSSYTSNVNKRIVSRICNIFFENYK